MLSLSPLLLSWSTTVPLPTRHGVVVGRAAVDNRVPRRCASHSSRTAVSTHMMATIDSDPDSVWAELQSQADQLHAQEVRLQAQEAQLRTDSSLSSGQPSVVALPWNPMLVGACLFQERAHVFQVLFLDGILQRFEFLDSERRIKRGS